MITDSLNETFRIPSSVNKAEDYADRLALFIESILMVSCLSAEEEHLLREHHKALLGYVSASTPVQSRTLGRRKLHSLLTDYPLYTTLLLLPEVSTDSVESSDVKGFYALLAHIYSMRGPDEYEAYLCFYNTFLSKEAVELPWHFVELKNSTAFELKTLLEKSTDYAKNKLLKEFARFLRRPHRVAGFKPQTNIFFSKNKHETELRGVKAGQKIVFNEGTDTDGQSNVAFLNIASQVPLTDKQERTQFSKQNSGIKNALRKREIACPFSLLSATPAEVGIFLDACSELIDKGVTHVRPSEAKYLFLFFLNLLQISKPLDMRVYNKRGRNAVHSKMGDVRALIYSLDPINNHISASINLPAKVTETAPPDKGDEIAHYYAMESWNFTLPYPLGSLLNTAFRNTVSSKRNKTTLGKAFGLNEADYNSWLQAKLKETKLNIKGLTKGKLESSFVNFAKESLPETFRAFLSGKSVVQNHYVNVPERKLNTSIALAWEAFCINAGVESSTRDTDENVIKMESITGSYHEEVGSPLTIRQSSITRLLSELSNQLVSLVPDVGNAISIVNLSALYAYIRIASTVGLRSVSKPFPTLEHFSPSLSLLSVADKRSHAKNERRLLFLTTSLKTLLCAVRKSGNKLSQSLGIPNASYALMTLNTESWCWEHFSRNTANGQIYKATDLKLSNFSFRHNAAWRFIHESKLPFLQSRLNLLLNHSRSDALAMNHRSIVSLESFSRELQSALDSYDDKYSEFDERVVSTLNGIARIL